MAAWLLAGASVAVSHDSAALLLGLTGVKNPPLIHISLPRAGRRSPTGTEGVVIHNVRDLEPLDIVKFKNVLPLTSATRTLIDLSRMCDPESFELMLDEALRRGLTRLSRLRWRLRTIGQGREGVALLNGLIEEREGAGLSQSVLETKFLRLLKRARLPIPVQQFEVFLAGRRAFLDFAYVDQRLAIEVDGYRYHSGIRSYQRDRDRNNALTNLGWRILRFTWKDVIERPDEVIEQIRRALGE